MSLPEIISEVRSLTGYDETVIDRPTMASLASRAQKELEADVGRAVDLSEPAANTATFWLLALFTKVHLGEVGGIGYSVAEIEARPQALGEQAGFWVRNYQRRRDEIRGVAVFGHVKTTRDDREYGVEDTDE